MTAREITVGNVPVRALRVTYVGELGWELYCPTEYGAALWDTLWAAGEPHGIVAGGYRAIDSLRLEKGYRVLGRGHHAGRDPLRGRARVLREARQGGRVHRPRRAARGAKEQGPRAGWLPGARGPARGRAGQRAGARRRRGRAGRVTSGGYGYTVGALDRLRLPAGRARRAGHGGRGGDLRRSGSTARSRKEPLFDPKGERIRA